MRSFAAAAVLFVPLVLASCTEEAAGPLSEKREPESISISAADIELNDGDTLQVFANLLDQNDNVFSNLPEGVEVDWFSEDTDVVEVEADGRLVAIAPGTATIVAETNDGLQAEAIVRVRAVAKSLVVVDGADQGGLPNAALPDSVVVRVVDRHGNGVAGVEVRFSVSTGGGSISPAAATSNAQGEVRVQWTLGPVIGAQSMQAFAPGAGNALTVGATISQVIFGDLAMPVTVTQGGTLAGTVQLDSNLFPTAIGAAHVVLSWDPAKLQLEGGSLSAGQYARSVRWFDNATGELHIISTDPDIARGDMAAAGYTFEVIGGAGTTTTIELDIEQLVGTNFLDASAAGVASDVVVTIN